MKYLTFFLFAILLFSCETNETANNNISQNDVKTEEPPQKENVVSTDQSSEKNNVEKNSGESLGPSTTQSKTAQKPDLYQEKLTDGKVTFEVMCQNGETSKYQISGTGFENQNVKFNGAVKGQLVESHLLDLNKDGFCEIYMVFDETSDSGNQMLKGFSSYRNKSAGEIYIKDTDMVRQMNTDKVYVEDKKLMRSFQDEKGNEIKFQYKLTKGETSFVLEPVKI